MLPEFRYLAPATLEEACAALLQHGAEAKVLAGGTDLLVKMKSGAIQPRCLVSLKKLSALKGLRFESGVGVVIGARTTHDELVASSLLHERFPSVSAAAANMAGFQIRQVGTIGGNLVNAVPSADLPPILIALGTRVCIAGWQRERREVDLENFFLGPGKTVLQPGEILAEVVIPEQLTTGSHYIKFGLRRAEALAVVGVATAVTLEANIIRDVRIVLGAVAPTPLRALAAEQRLREWPVREETLSEAGRLAAAAARPISDVRGSAEYRLHLVEVLTCDSLRTAIEQSRH
jgi:carbon-monoxide dehydrogenase medium subunit